MHRRRPVPGVQRKMRGRLHLGAFLATALMLGAARAEEPATTGIDLGSGLRFDAGLQNDVRWTDNMYLSEDDEVDATGYMLRPSTWLSYLSGNAGGRLGYRGEIGIWDSPTDDDYVDTEAFAAGGIQPLTKHALEGDAAYKRGHDPIGTGRTQGLTEAQVRDREIDLWDSYKAALKYTYGAAETKLRPFLRTSFTATHYQSNRKDPADPATGTRFLDNTYLLVGGGLFFALGPRIGFLVDAEHTEIEYDTDLDPALDGSHTQALAGFRYQISAKTHGDVLAGYFFRNFDDGDREDADGLDWRVALNWAPRRRTALSLELGRVAADAILLGENFIDRQFARLRLASGLDDPVLLRDQRDVRSGRLQGVPARR